MSYSKNVEISPDYIIDFIYQSCKRPLYKPYQNVYNAECPICNEGKHSGKKRRLYYFPEDKYFFCHNCNQSWTPLQWIQAITGEPIEKILQKQEQYIKPISAFEPEKVLESTAPVEELPLECLDLFHLQESTLAPKHVLDYIRLRRLDSAQFRPKSLYYCNQDPIHKGRLIIPFYDWNPPHSIVSYQSRLVAFKKDAPKYLTKLGDKYLYGLSGLDPKFPCIFILEGPIDAMFVKNGIAIGGAKMTASQEQVLLRLKWQFPRVIWILDNDKGNNEMDYRAQQLIEAGEEIFVWPPELKGFKDINEICVKTQRDSIGTQFLQKNTYSGLEAIVRRAKSH